MQNSPVISLAFRYLSIFERGIDGRLRLASISQSKALSSILGLSLGVMVLTVVLSVVNGFEREMRERVMGVLPHVVLSHPNGFSDWAGIGQELRKAGEDAQPLAVAPLENFQGLLINDKALAAIQISGILPSAETKVSIIDELMLSGELDDLNNSTFGIVLGSRLAERLHVSKGDALKLMLPEAKMSLLGVLPRYRQFKVVGIFEIGSIVDEQLAYIHINAAAKLLKKTGKTTSLRLLMPDLFDAPWHGWQLANHLNETVDQKNNEWMSHDWTDSQGSLYQIITMTKSMLGLLILLIVVVACFNLASGLIMLVSDKRSDIAILLSQGLSAKQIMQVFVLQAMLISITGLIIGFSTGVLLLIFLPSFILGIEGLFSIDLTSAYPVHYLPSEILMADIAVIAIAVLFLSFCASLYPAKLASHVNPAEELKYE